MVRRPTSASASAFAPSGAARVHSSVLLGLFALGCSDYGFHGEAKPSAPAEDSAAPEPAPDPADSVDSAPPDEGPPPVDTAVSEPEACACPEGFEPLPADDGCLRRVELEPTFLGAPAPVCPLIPHPDYGMHGARYPGGAVVTDDYWGEDDGVPDGRMNAAGVWACAADGVSPGYDPVGEWIGFSVCVTLDAPGDYLLGLGGDNRMRFAVDGVELRADADDDTFNFKYWWMVPVRLSSGAHIISIEGYNAGGPAGLGAELSGPFPAGSLIDDAAMIAQDARGAIVWSAADSLGGTFALGETRGWSCPDGSVLDLCADAPVCVSEERTDCL
jgi:hypothetical protein